MASDAWGRTLVLHAMLSGIPIVFKVSVSALKVLGPEVTIKLNLGLGKTADGGTFNFYRYISCVGCVWSVFLLRRGSINHMFVESTSVVDIYIYICAESFII